ncbi:putative ATP-dependent helicase DinG [Natranaerofaba carboxydovora]|nr:putative ATP-dependent helicase DinG [Natranaerofaba carboxydovora]
MNEIDGDSFQNTIKNVLEDFEFRDAQKEMMEYVKEAIDNSNYLMVEAGTGTGKSLAYLFPASWYVLNSNSPVVISTATIALQEQLINKEIPLINELWEEEIKAVLIKGRSNYVCLDKYYDKYNEHTLVDTKEARLLKEWFSKTNTGDWQEIEGKISTEIWQEISSNSESCLGYKCLNFKDCFVNKQKRRGANAHILITNHHLFFSDLKLKVEVGESFGILPEYECIIFDEAHHLEERALYAFGAKVQRKEILYWNYEMKRLLGGEPDFESERSLKLERQVHKLFNDLGKDHFKSYLFKEYPPSGFSELSRSLQKIAYYVEGFINREAQNPDKIENLANAFRRIQNNLDFILDTTKEDYVSWVEVNNKRNQYTLHSNPINASWHLNEYLYKNVDICILTSATLTVDDRFDYIKGKLGLEDCKSVIIPSPFDYKKQSAVFVPKNFPKPNENNYEDALIEGMLNLIEFNQGKALILFTSYRMLDYVYNELKERVNYKVLRQGQASKNEILKEFREDTYSILLATDSFREGIDVRGEALSLLMMDKLPFAVPDEPLIKARIEYLEKQGKNSFFSYSLPEAVLKLKQGFGRLIRHRNDSGIFAVFDCRIHKMPYGKVFLNSLPKCKIHDNFEQLKVD